MGGDRLGLFKQCRANLQNCFSERETRRETR